MNYSEGAKRRHERPEEKELNSQRLKKYFSNPENKQRLSRSLQKLWEKPAKKIEYLAALAKGRNTPEAKLNQSKGQKLRFSEDTEAGRLERLKNRERQLKVCENPEYIKHLCEMGKKAWQKTGYKENISQKVTAANLKRFTNPEARNQSAKGHGGREFVAIDVATQKIVYKGFSISMCAQILGIVRSSIQRHLHKIRKKPEYKGYTFEFIDS